MVVARLRGGLGNQLFQYAAASALAEHHQTSLKLDLYTYTKHKYRRFELGNFSISATEATREEVHKFTGSNKIIRYLNKRENYFRCPRVFSQPHYHYYEDFLKLPDDLYLSGYWQSEKYFLAIADKVRKWYSPKVPLDTKNLELLSRMRSVNSISIHVRKGDYSSSLYNQFYGGLELDYYTRAVELMRRKTESPVFFVFSDSIDWCRNNLAIEHAVYVEHNQGVDSYKDLSLMAGCNHNIIANSTFSWWGAWLNSNPNKIVIAPGQWFQKDYSEKKEPVYACRYYNTKDIIPADWTRI